jgi:sulfatase modifying factor 1
MKIPFFVILIPLFFTLSVWSATPVPYSGKIDIQGVNYYGEAQFAFSLHDGNGTTHWINGKQVGETIKVTIRNGRYNVVLGGQGMNPLAPTLFLDHEELYLKVEMDNNDGVGLRHLGPDQLITATPRALTAEWAKLAQGVPSGAITRAMLSAEIQADLNRTGTTFTPQPGSITGAMLTPTLLADLNASIGAGSISQVQMDPNLVRYFIPEISNNPAPVQIVQGAGTTLSVQANGKYLSYQWQRDGIALTGETYASLVLSDANVSVDDANYSVIIANDWGSISSSVVSVSVATALPTITISGSTSITHEAATVYTDAGATAVDALGVDLTTAITVTGADVNVANVSQQVVTYLVTDAGGNANSATRTVTVQDTTDPVITLIGDNNFTQPLNTAWAEPGYDVNDTLDGNLTTSVSITGTVDVNTTGVYTLTYTVADTAGNEVNASRVVNVVVGQASTHNADLNATVQLEMIWVEPGTFTMGQDGVVTPEHDVTLTKGFYLGKYEVTQAQYQAVMTGNTDSLSATPSTRYNGNANRPVETVSWDDIQIFLSRLNAQQSANIPAGWSYVLPTEAEWEYACRAGTTTVYSGGDTIAPSNANYSSSGLSQTSDAGNYAANPWGFFDMHGNVWEWTADRYGTYSSGAQTDPTGPASGFGRVCRGGSWDFAGTSLRSATRFSFTPSNRNYDFGFRVGFKQQ